MTHAFLIMAHKINETLFTLLKMLNHEKNGIFVHVDKKVAKVDYDNLKAFINTEIKGSDVELLNNRISVTWGGIVLSRQNCYYLKKH